MFNILSKTGFTWWSESWKSRECLPNCIYEKIQSEDQNSQLLQGHPKGSVYYLRGESKCSEVYEIKRLKRLRYYII